MQHTASHATHCITCNTLQHMQHTASHATHCITCNTLHHVPHTLQHMQHTATHATHCTICHTHCNICNTCYTLQHTHMCGMTHSYVGYMTYVQRCHALQMLYHTVTYRTTLQHTAAHCNTLQHTATHCNTLICVAWLMSHTAQHTATHCNTLQHTAAHCSTLQHTHMCGMIYLYVGHMTLDVLCMCSDVMHCNMLYHTETYWNTLQHTAAHYGTHDVRAAMSHTATQYNRQRCNTLQHSTTNTLLQALNPNGTNID